MTWGLDTGCRQEFIQSQWTLCWSNTRLRYWRTSTPWAGTAGQCDINTYRVTRIKQEEGNVATEVIKQ